jgi:hypothetical protein
VGSITSVTGKFHEVGPSLLETNATPRNQFENALIEEIC